MCRVNLTEKSLSSNLPLPNIVDGSSVVTFCSQKVGTYMKAQWSLKIKSERLNNRHVRYLSHAKLLEATVMLHRAPSFHPNHHLLLDFGWATSAFVFAAGAIKYSRI